VRTNKDGIINLKVNLVKKIKELINIRVWVDLGSNYDKLKSKNGSE